MSTLTAMTQVSINAEHGVICDSHIAYIDNQELFVYDLQVNIQAFKNTAYKYTCIEYNKMLYLGTLKGEVVLISLQGAVIKIIA